MAPHIVVQKKKLHGLDDFEIMNEIKEKSIDLLIIPDAGSENIEQTKELIEGGYVKDIIVLDHHKFFKSNPNAIIINNQSKFNKEITNTALSGAGVTYKFVQYFCEKENIKTPYYADLVAFSIVADVCDLSTLENRTFVYYGLSRIENTCLNEMWLMLTQAEELTPEIISWDLIPKINALTRSDNQELKMRLVRALSNLDQDVNYSVLIKDLKSIHTSQNNEVKKIFKKHEEQVVDSKDKVLIVRDDDCTKGFTGLIAGKITGKFNKPVLFVHESKENDSEYLKGSMRSPIPIQKELKDSGLFTYVSGKFIA